MVNSISYTTHQSWGSRMKGSLKGILVGFFFVIVSIHMLIWNEGNSVAAHKSLDEGLRLVQNVGIDEVNPDNEGTLIHVSGNTQVGGPVTDEVFGVTVEDYIKLRRNTEMYQWKESSSTSTKKNTGGSTDTTTTYSYSKEWSNYAIDSSAFELSDDHENPGSLPYTSSGWTAKIITMSAFTFSQQVLAHIQWYTELTGYSFNVDDIPEDTLSNSIDPIQTYQGRGFYVGNSPSSPAIGDVRITYEAIPASMISIVAQQVGNSFGEYTTSNGRTLLLVQPGVMSAEVMFVKANEAVTQMTWFIRLLGFVFIWFGLQAMVQPLSVFADVLPILGDCVEGISCFASAMVAACISCIVIALSWLAYRPFYSLLLLSGVGGIVYYCYYKKRQQKAMKDYVHGETEDLELQVQNKLQQDTGILASSTYTIHYSLLDVDAVTEVHPN